MTALSDSLKSLPPMPEMPRSGPWESENDMDCAWGDYHACVAKGLRARNALLVELVEAIGARNCNNELFPEIAEYLAACRVKP
jgi:hypothetical protein